MSVNDRLHVTSKPSEVSSITVLVIRSTTFKSTLVDKHMEDEYLSRSRGPLSRAVCESTGFGLSTSSCACPEPRTSLSAFERIISTHPPVLESLLLQLPTSSILDLYHTSNYLRSFLQRYPIAWNNLSFRSLSPGRLASRQTSPASDSSGDTPTQHSKLYALDQLLVTIILPFGTRLKSLELDHTAVSGNALTTCVLHGRRETIQHLSVRGCKQVSLKYNIVPFLNLFSLQKNTQAGNSPLLALKSLYTFRCRHHRRRPYTPASLTRRDSDSAPTHELIELCYKLGIWTDTGWCPTPGGRCLRRKDYSVGRGTPDARAEVWVVYDRLWRSGNRIGPSGPSTEMDRSRQMSSTGQLWEDAESGYNGEPLGCDSRPGQGEGKLLPAHLRQSHKKFVEEIKCSDCHVTIEERCEHCSIRMHCTGCRKTLCENCAFSRPLPQVSAQDTATTQKHWWAPGQKRNPNAMLQEVFPSSTPDNNGNIPNSTVTPAVKMQWCCLRPMFSNGGSISFVGPGMTGSVTNHLRTAPLPKGEGYEDPEFTRLLRGIGTTLPHDRSLTPYRSSRELSDLVLRYLFYGPGSNDLNACPRNLCQQCWNTPGWKSACRVCQEPFCYAHDLRGLSMRICGYKDLSSEKSLVEQRSDVEHAPETWQKFTTEVDGLLKYPRLPMDLASVICPAGEPSAPSANVNPWKQSGKTSYERQSSEQVLENGDTQSTTIPSNIEAPKDHDQRIGRRGCGAIMCPKYRAVGDHRPKCPATAQVCTLCEIWVCPECLVLNPPCDCSYCKEHYRCPNCFHMLAELCKKAEEEEEKLRKKREEELKKAIAAHKLRVYEEAIEKAGEFMAAVFGKDESHNSVS